MSFTFSRITSLPLALIILIAVTVSCRVTRPVENDPKDLSYLYNPVNNPINPRYRVFNERGDRSVLSVKLFTDEILFSEANPQGEPLASVTITVRLYDDSRGGSLADTAYIERSFNKNSVNPEIVVEIPLTTYEGYEYTAEVRVIDNLTRRMVQTFVRFNRLTPYSANNFRARDAVYGNGLFTNILRENEFVNLIYGQKEIDSLYVFYFRYFDFIPYPPSMMLPERSPGREPDLVIPIAISDTTPMMFPRKGIYLCSIDSNVIEGFTFFNFGEEYPQITRPETMIEPLAYFATQEEMNALRTSDKPKMAVDEFWIGRSTNIERSRELLRIYYNRVLFSNFYFTSYKEGWRTDRGMIYIMYGPPDKVYKSPAGEQWGYKKPVVKMTWGTRYRVKEEYLWFNFRYNPNRFTINDYYLNRTDATPTFWDQAVSDWRKGIVFRLDNPQAF